MLPKRLLPLVFALIAGLGLIGQEVTAPSWIKARIEALRLAEIFRAHVVDSTLESFIFEMTGTPEKIDSFADLMRPLGLRELARTGVAALSRGA